MIKLWEGKLSGLTITETNFKITPNCRDETHIKAYAEISQV